MYITVIGQGTAVNLIFPEKMPLVIGPVLPYEKKAIVVLEIENPSDYDTELFSLDFDKKFIEEETAVSKYSKL